MPPNLGPVGDRTGLVDALLVAEEDGGANHRPVEVLVREAVVRVGRVLAFQISTKN